MRFPRRLRRLQPGPTIFNLIQRELWTYSRIEVHLGVQQRSMKVVRCHKWQAKCQFQVTLIDCFPVVR